LRFLLFEDGAARQARQLPLRVGMAVVQRLERGSHRDFALRAAFGGLFDPADPIPVHLVAQLKAKIALVGHLAGGHGAHRAGG
jgi:hypothetical protein